MKYLTYLVNIPFYIFLTGLFLLPVIYSIEPRVEFEQVKVIFFQRWVEVFCFSVLLFSSEKFSLSKLLNKTNILLFSFFLVAILSSYLGQNYSKSFWGNPSRLDGLFTYAHFILLFYFLQLVWEKKLEKYVVFAIVLSSLLVSLNALGHGLSDYIYGMAEYSPWKGFYGTLGNPVFLGGYLLLTVPFFFQLKLLAFKIMSVFSILAIVSTLSRFAISGVLFFGILRTILLKVQVKPKTLFVGYILFSVCYFSYFSYKSSQITDSYKAGIDIVYEQRMRIYTKGFLAYLQRPILGFGFANFDKAFDNVDWPAKVPNDAYVDKAHSNFLEVVVTTGALGFVVYLGFLASMFKRLKWTDSFGQALTISFLLYLLNAQVNVTSITQDTLFWVFAGILTSKD